MNIRAANWLTVCTKTFKYKNSFVTCKKNSDNCHYDI